IGLYAQDQWTLRRLTLNYGLRFDSLHSYTPPQNLPAGAFVPARSFAEVDCIPCWHDVSPRVAGAYDLFGNGKTAIKAATGRYRRGSALEITNANAPVLTSTASTTRSWTDNGNFIPDCDLSNPAANLECGPDLNSTFGQPVITTRYDPSVLKDNRPYSLQSS